MLRLPVHLDRIWRVPTTGLAFAALGLGGSALALTVFPVVALLSRDRPAREHRTQLIIQSSFRLYLWALERLGLIRLVVEGADRLAACRGRLIVANHPTLLDVVILMALNGRVQCIVKHQLWRNPFLAGVIRAAGYIRNDLDPDRLVAACTRSLAEGRNVIIFPEGTRSVPGAPIRFQRGFANLAYATEAQIQLITITCEPITLTKGAPWWCVPESRAVFTVTIGDVIDPHSHATSQYRSVNVRRMTADIEKRYRLGIGQLTYQ